LRIPIGLIVNVYAISLQPVKAINAAVSFFPAQGFYVTPFKISPGLGVMFCLSFPSAFHPKTSVPPVFLFVLRGENG